MQQRQVNFFNPSFPQSRCYSAKNSRSYSITGLLFLSTSPYPGRACYPSMDGAAMMLPSGCRAPGRDGAKTPGIMCIIHLYIGSGESVLRLSDIYIHIVKVNKQIEEIRGWICNCLYICIKSCQTSDRGNRLVRQSSLACECMHAHSKQ